MKDGNLVLRAIPNPDRSKDDVEMLSGGIETSQSFHLSIWSCRVSGTG